MEEKKPANWCRGGDWIVGAILGPDWNIRNHSAEVAG
tara:strand:- start:43 stop:153 length:111 start_codon:yes stop_codon:yes gene_type:complete